MGRTKRAGRNTLSINKERLEQIREQEDRKKLLRAKAGSGLQHLATEAGPMTPLTGGAQGTLLPRACSLWPSTRT